MGLVSTFAAFPLRGHAHEDELAPCVDLHGHQAVVRRTEAFDALQPRRLLQPPVQRCLRGPPVAQNYAGCQRVTVHHPP